MFTTRGEATARSDTGTRFPFRDLAVSDSPQYDSSLPLASRSAGRPVAPAACVPGGGPGVTLALLSDTHSEEPHGFLPACRQSGGHGHHGGSAARLPLGLLRSRPREPESVRRGAGRLRGLPV